MPAQDHRLTRTAASAAVTDLGWRYVLGVLLTSVRVPSIAGAAGFAVDVTVACGPDADTHLRVDLRSDRVVIGLSSGGHVSEKDTELAGRISALATDRGLRTDVEPGRAVQVLEIAVDAMDIPAIRPFWQAVFAYAPGETGTDLVDPLGQGPAIWFQQMTTPRVQRNRIHFDISVPHDRAAERVRAAIEAGGVLVSDAEAPAFWVLADAEGNEVCITTWQGRDP
jgi:4a-hydroxytetrahydrobiopterin dehydratase